jgi:hypothetical protein
MGERSETVIASLKFSVGVDRNRYRIQEMASGAESGRAGVMLKSNAQISICAFW